MSKHAVSTEDETIAPQGDKTRRATLRALVSASALAIPTIGSISSTLPDPIFRAIARHKSVHKAALALSFAIDT